MKKIFITSLIGLLSAVSWGQSGLDVTGDACDHTNGVRITSTKFMYAHEGRNRPFQKPADQIFNLKNTRKTNGKQYIYLEFIFNNPQNRRGQGSEGDQSVLLEMELPNWLEPVRSGEAHNYPEGYNIGGWRKSDANDPSGGSGFPSFQRFSNDGDANRFNRGTYRMSTIKRHSSKFSLDRNPNTSHEGNGGNGTAMEFELKEGAYAKNYQLPVRVHTFVGFFRVRNPGRPPFTYRREVAYCSDHPKHSDAITIDLVRPTFDEMPVTTTKVDEEFSFDIPARDLDSNQNPIAQTLKTGVTAPTSHQNMEDGVYIKLKSVKKIVNLAGGGILKETRNDSSNNPVLPTGLAFEYKNGQPVRIKGTPEEIGEFEIEMIAIDANDNHHAGGGNDPRNYTAPSRILRLNITPRYGVVNPSMRMRVAQ